MNGDIWHKLLPIHRAVKTAVLLTTLTMLLGACSSYNATVEHQEDLRYDAISVQPAWEHHERRAGKIVLPIVGMAAGGAYGYETEFKYEGKTYVGEESAAIWAGLGLVGGVLMNRWLFSGSSRSNRPFKISESDEWLSDWNRSNGDDFLIREKTRNNRLVLVPRDRILAIRQDYNRLEDDLNREHPSTDYETLQEWRRKLEGEYSILPAEEASHVEELITENEEKVASTSLDAQLATVDDMDLTYESIQTLVQIQSDLGPVYRQADQETKQRFDTGVRDKIRDVLVEVLPGEHQKIDRIDISLSELTVLEDLREEFGRRYGIVRNHDLVDDVYDRFDNKKEEIVVANASRIESQIEGASSIEELNELRERYLADLPSERSETENLRRRLDRRNDAIAEARRQERIAARAAAQRRAKAAFAAENPELAAQNAQLTPNSLSVRGLRNERLISAIYTGEFAEMRFDRDDIQFGVLYNTYLESYSQQCNDFLPADKVRMTRDVCNEWTVTTNWGVETSRNCVGWRTEDTGHSADPDMYQAKRGLDLLQTTDVFRHVMGMVSADDPIATSLNMVGDALTLTNDINSLLRQNSCDSPSINRFQDNLRLFAESKRPRRLTNNIYSSSVINVPPGTRFEDQNYEKLIENLVYDESSSWVMNQYLPGTVSNVVVTSRDALGRPREISAWYSYNGISGRDSGSVRLTFDQGWPECMYFHDNPIACRTPDRRIVDAYASGAY